MKDGGPAFPHLGLYPGADGNMHPHPTQHGGMTLRDWFAGRALSDLVGREWTAETAAKHAYQLADAMLAERENDGQR